MRNAVIVTWLASRLRECEGSRMKAPQVISELYTTFGKEGVKEVFKGLDGFKKFITKESVHFVWEGSTETVSLAPKPAPSSRSASVVSNLIVTWLASQLREKKDHRMYAVQVFSGLYTAPTLGGKEEIQKVFTGLDGLKKFIIKESTHFVWEDLGLVAAISLAPEPVPASRSASTVSNVQAQASKSGKAKQVEVVEMDYSKTNAIQRLNDIAEEAEDESPLPNDAFEHAREMQDFFDLSPIRHHQLVSKQSLMRLSDAKDSKFCKDFAFFGHIIDAGDGGHDYGSEEEKGSPPSPVAVALNVHEPFCLVTTGVQGSGKSHTVGTIVESCLLDMKPHLNLRTPMSALVLHYDQAVDLPCECVSLMLSGNSAMNHLKKHGKETSSLPTVRRSIVLTSPCYYKQRKEMYKGVPNTEVHPLLFSWNDLQAAQLKKLMHVNEGDNQLYMSSFFDKLRGYQRENEKPVYSEFKKQMEEMFSSPGQSGPLRLRLDILDSLVAEAECNKDLEHVPLKDLIESGTMVIADLADPMMDANTANGVFNVLLEQFRNTQVSHGKLCVFDEAHKYLKGAKSGPLADSIVDTVRQMRHYGMRIAISTQSPTDLPPELLELTSVAICHRFHSRDCYNYLAKKIPLPSGDGFGDIMNLPDGQAFVFAANHGLGGLQYKNQKNETDQIAEHDEGKLFKIQIRRRITADGGASRTNKSSKKK